MKVALVNPNWTFEGSMYFGCREPHLPLEYGYLKSSLEAEGHETIIVDGHLDRLTETGIDFKLSNFQPDFTVVTTAPSYLLWRCAPPELRVPRRLIERLR